MISMDLLPTFLALADPDGTDIMPILEGKAARVTAKRSAEPVCGSRFGSGRSCFGICLTWQYELNRKSTTKIVLPTPTKMWGGLLTRRPIANRS